jgi:hypothetical protein
MDGLLARRMLVGIWTGVFWAPVVLTLCGLQIVAPVEENRRKAPAPAWESGSETREYVLGGIRWFEEHFGGRDELIRLKNQLDYSLYSRSDRIHIGKDGFLFYRSLLDTSVPEIDRTPLGVVADRVKSIGRLAEAVSARGATLVVVTIPLKHTVYEELLPATAPRLSSVRRFDQFREELGKLPGIVYFDATPVLREYKSRGHAFNRTDFHWSEPAAREVGLRLLAKIAESVHRTDWKPSWQTEFAPRRFSGGQAMFMPLLKTPSETALFPKVEPAYPREGTEPRFDWVVRSSAPADKLPPVVYIGDSFIWALHNTGFTQEFSVFRFSHVLRPDSKSLHRELPNDTRCVILQLIETVILTDYAPL